ncbi:MAG: response regulator [Bacteroidetes bacterium]|nr:response regulator [Bacteroidota bacterium]MBU1677330.1 response regulator [Bacteroidota bacterium]MBU2508281.1 response regulator [Bacteroidota bacterium]
MKNILVVEDDLLSQKTMRMLLRKEFNVDVCGSADDFYGNFSSKKYDLVIMDIGLPGKKDGLQLTTELKQMENYKDTPILCLTAYARSIDKIRAKEAGVDEYLAKPVYNEVLLSTINMLISSRED